MEILEKDKTFVFSLQHCRITSRISFWLFYTAQKMQFSIKDFFSKCDQIRNPADLVIFTEEILNGKLHFFKQCYSQSNFLL